MQTDTKLPFWICQTISVDRAVSSLNNTVSHSVTIRKFVSFFLSFIGSHLTHRSFDISSHISVENKKKKRGKWRITWHVSTNYFLKKWYQCESPVPLNWFALFDVECVKSIFGYTAIILYYIIWNCLILDRLCALLSTVLLLKNACDEQYLTWGSIFFHFLSLTTLINMSLPTPSLILLRVCTLEM